MKEPDTNLLDHLERKLHQHNVICGGWGHKAFECPSLNFRRGRLPRRKREQKPPFNYQQRARQAQPKHKNKSELRTIHDRYHNPDPIARLIGKHNESLVVVDDVKYPGLLDSGAQMSTITISQAKKMGLKIQSLDNLLDIEGSGGVTVPHDVKYPGLLDSGAQMSTITIIQAKKMGLKIQISDNLLDIEGSGGVTVAYIGYVEVNLQIPEIQAYNEDILMVMHDSMYGRYGSICHCNHTYPCCIRSDN